LGIAPYSPFLEILRAKGDEGVDVSGGSGDTATTIDYGVIVGLSAIGES
jgi:hypothetical protein